MDDDAVDALVVDDVLLLDAAELAEPDEPEESPDPEPPDGVPDDAPEDDPDAASADDPPDPRESVR